jgi:hypothetical protein
MVLPGKYGTLRNQNNKKKSQIQSGDIQSDGANMHDGRKRHDSLTPPLGIGKHDGTMTNRKYKHHGIRTKGFGVSLAGQEETKDDEK